ncbi:MAG: acetate/propionate family kinase [Deltaproteobacteria bacterium]|nr:acetate/propionate family kinase [Deltaproteobacteria bacterium]
MKRVEETSVKQVEPAQQAGPCVLTINGGSSSIKFALFRADSLQRILGGSIERIGLPDAGFTVKGPNRMDGTDSADSFSLSADAPDHAAAAGLLMDWLSGRSRADPSGVGAQRVGQKAGLTAAGHRVVHGGPKFGEPQLITAEMTAELRRLSSFDPEHLPAEILLMEAIHRRFPDLPQVACFDTAFHHGMPRVARLLPIPRKYDAMGVKRYGFHGLSYAFLMEELTRVAGPEAALGRVILAHLGNGASLAAVRGGKPMDTSMGFTPAAGVPMSTRSGDLDPGLVWYLAEAEQMGAKEFNEMVNSRSGLLGVSGTSSDMRDLLRSEAGDFRAAEAVEMFCYHVKKTIGAFAAVLGGLDTLVFAGGIGENAPTVRAGICEGLGFLGVELDAKFNAANESLISSKNSAAKVRVIQTNEELMIARSVCKVLGLTSEKENFHENNGR